MFAGPSLTFQSFLGLSRTFPDQVLLGSVVTPVAGRAARCAPVLCCVVVLWHAGVVISGQEVQCEA